MGTNGEGGLKEGGGGLFNLAKRITGSKNIVVRERVDLRGLTRTDLWFPGVILLFLTIRKW